jgi:hypothetical protein
LQARNSHQVLGADLKTQSDFIICYTKDGQAKVVCYRPYTIQLLYESETPRVVPQLIAGQDLGRTNQRTNVIDRTGKSVYAAHIKTRNKNFIGKTWQKKIEIDFSISI